MELVLYPFAIKIRSHPPEAMGSPLNRVATEGCPYNLIHGSIWHWYYLMKLNLRIPENQGKLSVEIVVNSYFLQGFFDQRVSKFILLRSEKIGKGRVGTGKIRF
jgi:hypothetical protein